MDIVINTPTCCKLISCHKKSPWHAERALTIPHCIPRCHQTLSPSFVDMRNIHFDTLLSKGEETRVAHFVSELCLSWQNETCCSASAFCCVYTVLCHPREHTQAHTRTSALFFLFFLTQIIKMLCVGWNINRRDYWDAHVCVCDADNLTREFTVFKVGNWSSLQTSNSLQLPRSPLCLFPTAISTNCFQAVTFNFLLWMPNNILTTRVRENKNKK